MKAPAGFYPANQLIQHVVMAGCEIRCLACGAVGRLPLPRAADYGRQVENHLGRHRLCASAGTASDPSFREPNRGAA